MKANKKSLQLKKLEENQVFDELFCTQKHNNTLKLQLRI